MTTTYSERPRYSPDVDWLTRNAHVLSIAAFFVACCIIFTITSSVFLTAGNLLNVLRQSAPLMIVAIAMTFVITSGGIDLSIGSMIALVNASTAILLHAAAPWPWVVVGMLLVGGALGLAQGWVVAFQRIPAFIVTLGWTLDFSRRRFGDDRRVFNPYRRCPGLLGHREGRHFWCADTCVDRFGRHDPRIRGAR